MHRVQKTFPSRIEFVLVREYLPMRLLISSDRLMQAEERKDRHNDDNQSDQINNIVHNSLP